MSNITNLNRDYLIKINVKEATIDVPKMTFWNTDKKTSNMFVQLVINMSENELIKNYVTIENATDYKITLNVIKPKTNQYRTFEAKLLNEEKALFEIDLTSEFIDQVGDYSFEFEVSSKVDSNDESITTSNATYEVKGSILTNLNEETSSSPDLPILKQLIEQVKSLQGGDLTGYQKKSDNSLETTSKEVVGAINEVNSQYKDIAKKIENVGGFDTSKFMYVTKEVEDVDVPCTGIALNTNTLTFTGSDTQTLTVTKTPSNTTDKVTYATNPTGIVVVNNGVVTPIKNGSTVITVTCGSKTATCNVTVAGISTTVAVQSVSLNKNTTTINVGETETLVATISPIDATNQNVTWGTDAPNIATVTNGVIEGKAVGTASISVETVDGSHTDTCNVTVQQNTTGTSKNIFDKDTMLANPAKGINSTARYSTIDASWKACEIPVKANTQYSIKKCESTLYSKYSSGQNGNIGFLNSDRNLISSLHLAQRSVIDDAFLTNYPMAVAIEDYSNTGTTTIDWVTITTPENCAYLVFNTNLGCTPDTVQVEEGDTIHNYYTSYKGGNN